MKQKKIILVATITAAAVLSSCASPPPPPSCKGDNKRPINGQQDGMEHVSSLNGQIKASFNACS